MKTIFSLKLLVAPIYWEKKLCGEVIYRFGLIDHLVIFFLISNNLVIVFYDHIRCH